MDTVQYDLICTLLFVASIFAPPLHQSSPKSPTKTTDFSTFRRSIHGTADETWHASILQPPLDVLLFTEGGRHSHCFSIRSSSLPVTIDLPSLQQLSFGSSDF